MEEQGIWRYGTKVRVGVGQFPLFDQCHCLLVRRPTPLSPLQSIALVGLLVLGEWGCGGYSHQPLAANLFILYSFFTYPIPLKATKITPIGKPISIFLHFGLNLFPVHYLNSKPNTDHFPLFTFWFMIYLFFKYNFSTI